MRSRYLLPAFVMIENSTAFPSRSTRVPFCWRKPSAWSRFIAAAGSYVCGFSFELNQNLFVGEIGPIAGVARDENAIRQRSARLMASDIARRNAVDLNQVFL